MLAIQLIDQVASEEFHPENYEDKQRQQVRDLIERKVKGEEITAAPAEAPKAQVIDLMAALKASLAASTPSAEKAVSLADRKPAKRSANTPKAAADTAAAGGMFICLKPSMVAESPGPSNQPNSFWDPWAKNTTPSASRTTRWDHDG